jgi:uncharacterized protein (DUF58 family)
MDTKELLKKVRKVEIKTRGISNHIFSGEYHSAFKGRGMSFSEVREYQYGDDVRSIDWNVTARFHTPYVKIFEEERELTVMLLVDVSSSESFGTINQTKKDLITEISAVLSFSATTNNDKVGVIFFSDRIEKFIPPKKGRFHILRIIRELIELQPVGKKTDLKVALDFFNHIVKKRAIIFILSDFFTTGYSKVLDIAARKHDLVGIQVVDPAEIQLPDAGLIPAMDPETGDNFWLDSASQTVRRNFRNHFIAYEESFRQAFMKCGTDAILVTTDKSYVKALLSLFKKREHA